MAKQALIFLIADRAMRRSPAFETARRLAERTGSTLHIFLPAWSRPIALAGLLFRRQAGQAREGHAQQLGHLLELEADALRETGLPVSTSLVWTRRGTDEALRRINTLKPGLVIKDAEPESAAAVLAGGADRRLLRSCNAPVLLVHGDSSTHPLCVAAAVDPQRGWPADFQFGKRIASTAAHLATILGAELHLLYVDRHLQPATAASRHGHYRSAREKAAEPASDGLAVLASGVGVPAGHCHRIPGPVAQALAEFTSARGVDLLVIGVQPRPAWKRLLLGNRTERISRYASCDLLVLKPDPEGAAEPRLVWGGSALPH
ncbi:MAG TPA: universal stress protein [Nevskia sp.]|nr:universal stress protein [Nevskia sp.]